MLTNLQHNWRLRVLPQIIGYPVFEKHYKNNLAHWCLAVALLTFSWDSNVDILLMCFWLHSVLWAISRYHSEYPIDDKIAPDMDLWLKKIIMHFLCAALSKMLEGPFRIRTKISQKHWIWPLLEWWCLNINGQTWPHIKNKVYKQNIEVFNVKTLI